MTATLNQQHRIEHTLSSLSPSERQRKLSAMIRMIGMEAHPETRAMMTAIWEHATAVHRKLELQESLAQLESMALPEGPPIERAARAADRRWMLYLPLAVLVLFCWARLGFKFVLISFAAAVLIDHLHRRVNNREQLRRHG